MIQDDGADYVVCHGISLLRIEDEETKRLAQDAKAAIEALEQYLLEVVD